MTSFLREVSRRVFAQELRESDFASKDESDQYAPQYILTPTGAKVNRIYLVGVLIEKEDIGTDSEYWRGKVSDPTGTFTIYAGQYHPEAAQFLSECELPVLVAVVGKTSTYTTDDGNVLTSIRPESIQEVDEITRDLWILDTAKQTLERIKAVEEAKDQNSKLAKEQYSTNTDYYRSMVKKAIVSI
jgi:RPA family protein